MDAVVVKIVLMPPGMPVVVVVARGASRLAAATVDMKTTNNQDAQDVFILFLYIRGAGGRGGKV